MHRPSPRKRGYDHAWQKVRAAYLASNPLCVTCLASGRTTAAQVVDHISPIAKTPHLRLDPANLQSLCKRHHDSDKQSFERRGYSTSIGLDGWPVDLRHPARR